MSDEIKILKPDENMGDDACRVPKHWFLQAQEDLRFSIKAAKERREADHQKSIARFVESM